MDFADLPDVEYSGFISIFHDDDETCKKSAYVIKSIFRSDKFIVKVGQFNVTNIKEHFELVKKLGRSFQKYIFYSISLGRVNTDLPILKLKVANDSLFQKEKEFNPEKIIREILGIKNYIIIIDSSNCVIRKFTPNYYFYNNNLPYLLDEPGGIVICSNSWYIQGIGTFMTLCMDQLKGNKFDNLSDLVDELNKNIAEMCGSFNLPFDKIKIKINE